MLTKQVQNLLKECGNSEEDFKQIETCFHKCKFELDDKKISRQKALDLLGWKRFWAGISRTAFHASAVQKIDDYSNKENNTVFFKWDWWKEK